MNIAIIGAGLVGRLLAWRLNEYYLSIGNSVQITLVDENERSHFSTGLIAAAMVAPYTEAVNTEAITQVLGARSYQLWPEWLAELKSKTDISIDFNQQGTLVVSHAQDDPDWQRFYIKAQAVVDDGQMQQLDKSALGELEPELTTNFSKALYFANEGAISNLDLYPALEQYFDKAENISWLENTYCDSIDSDGTVTCSGEKLGVFDKVFDCRGNGAKADLKEFRSVRGEVIRVRAPEVHITRAVRLMHPRFPLYIAPRANDEYIIGATQIESDADTPVTIRSGLELLSALYSLHPGFGEAQIIEMLSGLRPTFINNLPRIEINERVISINGLYRHGYLFAPALVNDLISHLSGDESGIHFPQFLKAA